MASSRHTSIRRGSFGTRWNGRFSSQMSRQISSNCIVLSWQYGPKSLEGCFQQFIKNMTQRFKALLKAKEGPTFSSKGGPNKVDGECVSPLPPRYVGPTAAPSAVSGQQNILLPPEERRQFCGCATGMTVYERFIPVAGIEYHHHHRHHHQAFSVIDLERRKTRRFFWRTI